MPIEQAEQIYRLFGIGVGIVLPFALLFWHHRTFYDPALVECPESLSAGQLRRILNWGRVIYSINANNPKGEEIRRRIQLALDEVRRRRVPPGS